MNPASLHPNTHILTQNYAYLYFVWMKSQKLYDVPGLDAVCMAAHKNAHSHDPRVVVLSNRGLDIIKFSSAMASKKKPPK